jgi:hypothetical protein
MPELREGIRLDLTDPLAADPELPAHLRQGPGWPSSNPNHNLDELAFPVGHCGHVGPRPEGALIAIVALTRGYPRLRLAGREPRGPFP